MKRHQSSFGAHGCLVSIVSIWVMLVLPSSVETTADSLLHIPEFLTMGSGKTPPEKSAGVCVNKLLDRFLYERSRTIVFIPFDGAATQASFVKQVQGKKCAIVGNSGALLDPPHFGSQIDDHDVVMRFNQAPLTGYDKYVGNKTSFRLVNRLWSYRYSYTKKGTVRRRKWAYNLPREKGITIISTRTEAPIFSEMIRIAKIEHPQAQLNFAKVDRRVTRLTQDFVAQFRACREKTANRKYGGGTSPSSGMIAITLLVGLCKSITTFGIGGTWTATTPYQYYTFLHSERPDGNPTHSFSAEQALVRHLADSGIIRMCTSKGCTSPSKPNPSLEDLRKRLSGQLPTSTTGRLPKMGGDEDKFGDATDINLSSKATSSEADLSDEAQVANDDVLSGEKHISEVEEKVLEVADNQEKKAYENVDGEEDPEEAQREEPELPDPVLGPIDPEEPARKPSIWSWFG